MTRSQHTATSDKNQQIQADGDVNAQFAADGGISIAGDNHGVVITSAPTPDEPQYTFDISKKKRIPAPNSMIGIISGLITIAGFVTGGFSIKQLIDRFLSGTSVNAMTGIHPEYWLVLASLLTIGLGVVGWLLFGFFRRNVLRLPKRWFFPAWAGIKEENGQTYPYSLRLAMRCPKCKNQNLRFQQVPEKWVDFYDSNGDRMKRHITNWASMAVCPRNEDHSIPIDISGNDFDEALPR